jgi:hypothetical protein
MQYNDGTQTDGCPRMLLTAVQTCQKKLPEVLRQRAAISAVLRAIANSPHDLQPIFDTILDNAVHLCRAEWGGFRLIEEEGLRLVALKPNSVASVWVPPMLLKNGSYILVASSEASRRSTSPT